MRRLRLTFTVLLAAAMVAAGAPASSQSGYDLVEACRANGGSESMCKGLHQLLRIPGAACRDLASDDPACAIFDGLTIDEALVAAHEHSWLTEALALQRDLDGDRPLVDELWTHSHNSNNADAYPLQVTGGLDRNQIYTVRDQLRMGVRAIELDLHWAPHITTGGTNAVQVCHGEPIPLAPGLIYHLGCELNSPLFTEHLAEIKVWMDDNPGEVVMLYLENVLDNDPQAHDEAAAAIDAAFGDLVSKPQASCATMPMDTSRNEIRDAGARVIITGNCGPGAWGEWVHLRGSRWKEGGLDYGDDFPAYPCTERRAAQNYDANWIRHFGDETGLSAGIGTGGDVTPTDALNMTRCGVNMIGWDNLVPFDERMAALVWSWRPNEPSTTQDGYCASHDSDGRFVAKDCSVTEQVVKKKKKKKNKKTRKKVIEVFTAQPFACFDGSSWAVTAKSDRFANGDQRCAAEGLGSFAVPWNGYENERLKDAKGGATDVWLNHGVSNGAWVS